MFQFPAFAPYTLSIRVKVTIAGRVSPFGYPRISAYSQLPAAFRSVSRPSSPLIAKAFTKCPYLSLDSYNINILLSQYAYIFSTKNLLFTRYSFEFWCIFLYFFYLDFFDNIIFCILYYSASFLIYNVL